MCFEVSFPTEVAAKVTLRTSRVPDAAQACGRDACERLWLPRDLAVSGQLLLLALSQIPSQCDRKAVQSV